MSKNLIIGLVIGVLVVGAGGYMLVSQQNNNSQDQNTVNDEPSAMQEQQQDQNVASIVELMKRTGSFTCTYTEPETGSTGTIYVSSGKMRGDFEVQTADMEMNSHMISNEDTVYMWTDGTEQGMSFSIENLQEVNSDEDRPTSVDFQQRYSYDCDSWNVDDSKFEVPENVEFIDYSDFMIPQITSVEDGTPVVDESDQCAVCESLSGQAKTQCLQSLNCN